MDVLLAWWRNGSALASGHRKLPKAVGSSPALVVFLRIHMSVLLTIILMSRYVPP
jgi:hypothetical protein